MSGAPDTDRLARIARDYTRAAAARGQPIPQDTAMALARRDVARNRLWNRLISAGIVLAIAGYVALTYLR